MTTVKRTGMPSAAVWAVLNAMRMIAQAQKTLEDMRIFDPDEVSLSVLDRAEREVRAGIRYMRAAAEQIKNPVQEEQP
jgi:hypothetical protein